ncbi:30S ribosomal protein S7 [Wolbachia endosymbiont of Pentidionis agamae]|uniref:30S ribosomal protein S7 n=1 Tax=Wolbachia endosymbiont of Pentidionis agamae TaxID=3110435 RepID=UPI002FD5CE21
MRRKRIKKRRINNDSRYGSHLVMRFINTVMKDGKKSIAEKVVYDALRLAEDKVNKDGLSIFEVSIANITPSLEVRSKRIGGATCQVPIEIQKNRGIFLAFRAIIRSVFSMRKKIGKKFSYCLCSEILDAFNKRGSAFKIYEDNRKMVEANKASSYFNF